MDFIETVLMGVPCAIFWKDCDGKFLGCNDLFLKLANLNHFQDIVGKKDIELPWADRSELYREDDVYVIKTLQTITRIEKVTLTDKEIYVKTTKTPLIINGKVIGVNCTFQDITDLIEARKIAEAANKAKSDFLAVVSHELRTPLTGIIGMAELAQSEKAPVSPKKKISYLKHIESASKHLLAVVNNILDFAKLEENKFDVKDMPINLREIVSDVTNMMKVKATERKVILCIDNYPQDLPPILLGDQKALTQILLNLLGNALKFTEKGLISIAVHLVDLSKESASISIKVEDTGVGIPEDKLEKIFERFEQVDSSVARVYGGTGLGLAVTKKLVELMHGNIRVESKLGKGSTFYVDLTLKCGNPQSYKTLLEKSKQEEVIALEPQTAPTYMPIKSKRVLLVEDDPLIQMIHQSKLENFFQAVDVAHNGKTALDLFDEHQYEMIFMDIGLPDLTGNEVIQEIRTREKDQQRIPIPIIALTAYIDEDNRSKSLEAGADQVMSKPIETSTIADVFHKFSGGNHSFCLSKSEADFR